MTYLQKQEQFLIASIIPHSISDNEAFKELKELKELVDAYGGKVVEFVIQRREVHDKGHYLGKGKVEEIAQYARHTHIDVVVLNAIVKPGHIYDMKNYLSKINSKIQVWDRIDLILEIFSKHAHTTESRLQIELAAMRHMGPRIYGMGHVLSRQGGSIGTRGIGETNTELMKRHWRGQMKKVQDKLKKLTHDRKRQLERRRKMGLQTVSIVGYTNAGKTSLYNLLTKKKNRVENSLFATLDASVGRMKLPYSKKEVLVSDTIGFIRNLPTTLIDAFNSTLLESIHSDVLLHVIDSSDDDIKRKIITVQNILKELNVYHKETIYIFNKIDSISKEKCHELQQQYSVYSPVFISTKTGEGIDILCRLIEEILLSQSKIISKRQDLNTTFLYNYSYDPQ